MSKPPVCANNGKRKNLGKSDDPYDEMPMGDDMDTLHWEFEQQTTYKSLTDYLLARLVVATEENRMLLECINEHICEARVEQIERTILNERKMKEDQDS